MQWTSAAMHSAFPFRRITAYKATADRVRTGVADALVADVLRRLRAEDLSGNTKEVINTLGKRARQRGEVSVLGMGQR